MHWYLENKIPNLYIIPNSKLLEVKDSIFKEMEKGNVYSGVYFQLQ